MCHLALVGNDWIIRAGQLNRIVLTDKGRVPLKNAIKQSRVLGSYTLDLRSRPGVAARTAKLEVSVTQVTYSAPSQYSKWVKNCGIKQLPMQVVVVKEIDAPKGVTPIFWVILTSLPVNTLDDAWQIIGDYELRWLIEEYHKAMKSGCGLEIHALRTADRLEPLIG